MADNTTHLRELNEQYRQETRESLYQYASHPTENSVRYVFTAGVLTNLSEAESYMRWALEAVRSGRLTHNQVAYITPDGRA